MNKRLFAILCASVITCGAVAEAALENHYTFDSEATALQDKSGNERHAFLDDFDVGWVNDASRGGVMEFGGNTSGFLVAEAPELPSNAFTIMLWAYRDPDLAGGSGGANDGLFQLTLGDDDPENLPVPGTGGTSKVVGGWVQKDNLNTEDEDEGRLVWGRVIDDAGTANNLDKIFVMDDEKWTHFAYRGNGEDFELVINGDSSDDIATFYDESLFDHDTIYIGRQGTETWGGRLDDFRIYSDYLSDDEIKKIIGDIIPGDFNGNKELDVEDIDLLTAEVIAGTNTASFDLDNDALVNQEDRRVWVEDLRNTYFGDANLDGEFSSTDFVAVFGAAKYETGEAAGWGEGDWNGDGVFSSSDFVAAFGGAGYEQGPRPVAAVPEPSTVAITFMGLIGLLTLRRR